MKTIIMAGMVLSILSAGLSGVSEGEVSSSVPSGSSVGEVAVSGEPVSPAVVRSRAASQKCWSRSDKPTTLSKNGKGNLAWVPAVTRNGSVNCYLEWDQVNKNYGVEMLQYNLRYANAKFYLNGIIDGYYGPTTYNAVYNLQANRGIGVDGYYGPATRNAMWWETNAGVARLVL